MKTIKSVDPPFNLLAGCPTLSPDFGEGWELQIDGRCIPILSRTERETRMGQPPKKKRRLGHTGQALDCEDRPRAGDLFRSG